VQAKQEVIASLEFAELELHCSSKGKEESDKKRRRTEAAKL
jgi:hypothetical protein